MDYNEHFNSIGYRPSRLRGILLGHEPTGVPLVMNITTPFLIGGEEYWSNKRVGDLKEEDKQYLLGLYRATNNLPISI